MWRAVQYDWEWQCKQSEITSRVKEWLWWWLIMTIDVAKPGEIVYTWMIFFNGFLFCHEIQWAPRPDLYVSFSCLSELSNNVYCHFSLGLVARSQFIIWASRMQFYRLWMWGHKTLVTTSHAHYSCVCIAVTKQTWIHSSLNHFASDWTSKKTAAPCQKVSHAQLQCFILLLTKICHVRISGIPEYPDRVCVSCRC